MAADRPIRTLFIYHPDGCTPELWHPSASSSNPSLKAQSAPLEKVKQYCTFMDGFYLVGKGDTHEGGAVKVLTANDASSSRAALHPPLKWRSGSSPLPYLSPIKSAVLAVIGRTNPSVLTAHRACLLKTTHRARSKLCSVQAPVAAVAATATPASCAFSITSARTSRACAISSAASKKSAWICTPSPLKPCKIASPPRATNPAARRPAQAQALTCRA